MSTTILYKHLVTLLEESASEPTYFECDAEDKDHASEQALNAYPNGKVIKNVRIDGDLPGRSWLRAIQPGDSVWWSDPDQDLSSWLYRVEAILTESGKIENSDDIIRLRSEDGSVAEVTGIELHIDPQFSIAELASKVAESISDEGCSDDLTVVGRIELAMLLDRLNQTDFLQEGPRAFRANNAESACLFMKELLDSVESLTAIAEQHGPRTLADLMYLQSAILEGGFIDHYPSESKALELVQHLPSGQRWAQHIKVQHMLG